VCWHNTIPKSFPIHNGTRQGSALSPYLFTRYIRDILLCITNSNIGCNTGGCTVNILAYADDLVLLAPSWRALQLLLDKLHSIASHLDMICNSSKTVCTVVNPKRRCNMVAYQFPNFMVNNVILKYVNEFKYLCHVVSNSQLDDADINRERKNLFYRCNMLTRRLSKCSVAVKPQCLKLFACAFMISVYGVILRLEHLPSFSLPCEMCQNIFRYSKFYSDTMMLSELALPRFEEIAEKYRCDFRQQMSRSNNGLVSIFSRLSVW